MKTVHDEILAVSVDFHRGEIRSRINVGDYYHALMLIQWPLAEDISLHFIHEQLNDETC